MGKLLLAALAAVVLAGCSGAVEAPSARCATRTGPYSNSYIVRSELGVCGTADPERSVLLVANEPTVIHAPCVGTVTYSADNCTQTYEHTCPWEHGATITIRGTATWSEDGLTGTAVEAWRVVADDGAACDATYDVASQKSDDVTGTRR